MAAVPEPDLEIRGEGPGHPDPEPGRSPKNFSSAHRASVWSKNKGGAPGSATELVLNQRKARNGTSHL